MAKCTLRWPRTRGEACARTTRYEGKHARAKRAQAIDAAAAWAHLGQISLGDTGAPLRAPNVLSVYSYRVHSLQLSVPTSLLRVSDQNVFAVSCAHSNICSTKLDCTSALTVRQPCVLEQRTHKQLGMLRSLDCTRDNQGARTPAHHAARAISDAPGGMSSKSGSQLLQKCRCYSVQDR